MVKKFIYTLFLFYIGFVATLFFFQKKLQYMPSGNLGSIDLYNLEGFFEKNLITTDNIKIISWYKKPKNNQKTVLYFHGNGGNLAGRIHRYQLLGKNYGVLAVSYRGYSGNKGVASEKGFFIDANTAYKFLKEEGIRDENIILYGESIGSAVALNLARNKKFDAIILESPFYSALSVASSRYPFVPVKFLLKDQFRSDIFVENVDVPILIFHGTGDKVVDYSEGEKLFAKINGKKKFITVKNANHLDFSNDFLAKNIEIFLSEVDKNVDNF